MAVKIGTAASHRALFYDLIDFLTTDPALVGAGHNWTIEKGVISNQVVQYLSDSINLENGSLTWDRCTALGDVDYWNSMHLGWSGTAGELTTGKATLGFESTAAVRPSYYKITAPLFDETLSKERGKQAGAWDVQYSDDGVTWTTLQSDSTNTATMTSLEVRTYQMPLDNNDSENIKPRKFWRLSFTANGGDSSWVQVGRLRFYDSADNWISYRYGPNYVIKAPGMSGTDEIYFNWRLLENSQYDAAWIATNSFRSWNPADAPPDQVLYSPNVYVPLWLSETPYWFIANGQRLIMVAKVSTTYSMMYQGKFYPYGTPAEYPYPVISAGHMDSVSYRWQTVNAENLSIQCPAQGANVFLPQNVWSKIACRTIYRQESWGSVVTSPSSAYYLHSSASAIGCPDNNNNYMKSVQPNEDGTVCTLPYILLHGGDNLHGALGELDGMRWVYAIGVAPEDVINIAGQDYMAVPNAFRSDPEAYCLVELK